MLKSKALLLIVFAVAAGLLLSGCTRSSQLEDQAYILVMGLDRTEDGQIEMTVQIPRISGGTSEKGSGGGTESYMKLSVKADDFEGALEKLNWASPRDVNLSQLKLIVISRELAESPLCEALIKSIAQTERLYTATKVAVCEDKARDFIEAIKPFIGTRISTDIEAMFDHYNDEGYVPESSLAELYYQAESAYSDPMISYAILNNSSAQTSQQPKAQPASALSGSIAEISSSYESEIATRYLGAALFSDGRMCAVFDGNQTIIANLLRNELDSFRYECDGQSLEIVPTRAVYTRVDVSSEPVRISLNIHLSYAAQERIPDEEALRESLKEDIQNAINFAQQHGSDPFGFAERAARSFMTLEDWVDYDWKSRFQSAQIDIKINFAQSDT